MVQRWMTLMVKVSPQTAVKDLQELISSNPDAHEMRKVRGRTNAANP